MKQGFIAEYSIHIDEFNQNHAADGKFGSGGDSGSGGEDDYGGRVTPAGNGKTVSVTLGGKDYKFTDTWNKADISMLLHSDYAYQFHTTTDKQVEDVNTEVEDHPDSMVAFGDDGSMTMFTNNPLDGTQLEGIVWGCEAKVDEHERENGATGEYDLANQWSPSDDSMGRE